MKKYIILLVLLAVPVSAHEKHHCHVRHHHSFHYHHHFYHHVTAVGDQTNKPECPHNGQQCGEL